MFLRMNLALSANLSWSVLKSLGIPTKNCAHLPPKRGTSSIVIMHNMRPSLWRLCWDGIDFFYLQKRDHINVFAQSQLALSKSIFLFSLIFSPGGKRHKNEIVQDISYFAFTSFAKPGWELMHFRWRPDLSMFQYQDLMIALPTPLEGLFNLG